MFVCVCVCVHAHTYVMCGCVPHMSLVHTGVEKAIGCPGTAVADGQEWVLGTKHKFCVRALNAVKH